MIERLAAACLTALTLNVGYAASIDACAHAARAEPERYEAALCFYRAALANGAWEQARQHLESLGTQHPEIAWYPLVYGYVLTSTGEADPTPHYATAAERFAAVGEPRGELLARSNLRLRYFDQGQVAMAGRELERVRELGRSVDDPEYKVRALVVEARHLIDLQSDLNAAEQALREASALVDDSMPYFLRREIVNDLGQLSLTFGRFVEAIDTFRASEQLARQHDDNDRVALAQVNAANALLELYQAAPHEVRFEVLQGSAEEALHSAEAAGALPVELLAMRTLAEVLAASQPQRALALTRRCVERAASAALFWQQSQCLWVQAYALVASAPDAARATITKAVQAMLAAADGAHAQTPHAWRYLMRIDWHSLPADRALASAARALDAIEALRATQPASITRSAVFSSWARDYKWLAGQLFAHAENARGTPAFDEAIERAFSMTERMRARGLIESLRGGAKPVDSEMRDEVVHQIAVLNGALLRTSDDLERGRLLHSLRLLEAREAAAVGVAPAAAAPVKLSVVRSALAEHEALLVLLVAPEGSRTELQPAASWALLVTRDAVRLEPLPAPAYLLRMARLLQDPSVSASIYSVSAHSLYKQALEPLLTTLSTDINTLVVVPDSPLSTLPFGALSTHPTYQPLSTTYAVVMSPSAASFLHWRTSPRPAPTERALVVADPDLSAFGAIDASLEVWKGADVVKLSALPGARLEAAAIRAALPDSTLWLGSASTEHALKSQHLSAYGVLHFAAHAVVDDTRPERSALLLAPGQSREDGLLQAREIGQLTLNGQLVVLASCQSALGRDVRGEGIVSLSRAFLAAGAGAVLGTLWPVEDDATSAFISSFYDRLAQGITAAEALRATQQALMITGHPRESWAAFVLLGEASWRLNVEAAGTGECSDAWVFLPVLLVFASVAVLLIHVRSERVRRQLARDV